MWDPKINTIAKNNHFTGPVPTFCSEKPEVSMKQLKESPEYAFDCLQALVSKLLARRELTREEAMEYYKDPREGDFRKVLRRSWIPPEDNSSQSKGKDICKKFYNICYRRQ